MFLVPKPPRAEARPFPVYSYEVCRALTVIRRVHSSEAEKLNPADRSELADALRLLSIASLLEAQLQAIEPGE